MLILQLQLVVNSFNERLLLRLERVKRGQQLLVLGVKLDL